MDLYTKQPADKIRVQIDMSEYLRDSDNIASATATGEAGITVGASPDIDTTAKTIDVWVSDGDDDTRYKVTATITSDDGEIYEHDFYVKVREL